MNKLAKHLYKSSRQSWFLQITEAEKITACVLHSSDFHKEVYNLRTQRKELQVVHALKYKTTGCRDRNRLLDSYKPHSANLKRKHNASQLKRQWRSQFRSSSTKSSYFNWRSTGLYQVKHKAQKARPITSKALECSIFHNDPWGPHSKERKKQPKVTSVKWYTWEITLKPWEATSFPRKKTEKEKAKSGPGSKFFK